MNKNAFSLQLQPFEVLMWHYGLHKSNLAIAYVRLLAMLVNSFENYLSFLYVLYSDQDRMLSTFSVHRMKKSFPCHVTVRLGWGILLCFAGYLLCPVNNNVIRGIHKGVPILFLSPHESVSVLGSCGVLRRVGYQQISSPIRYRGAGKSLARPDWKNN